MTNCQSLHIENERVSVTRSSVVQNGQQTFHENSQSYSQIEFRRVGVFESTIHQAISFFSGMREITQVSEAKEIEYTWKLTCWDSKDKRFLELSYDCNRKFLVRVGGKWILLIIEKKRSWVTCLKVEQSNVNFFSKSNCLQQNYKIENTYL